MAVKKAKKEVTTKAKEAEVQRIEPTRALSPFEEMDRMFEDFLPRRWMQRFGWERPGWGELMRSMEDRLPRTDVIERDEDILVRAEIPGIAKEDLDVTVTENSVTMKGETKREEKEEKGDYYRCEISSGSFSRTVALPSDVNPDKAKATFTDGMLELTLPKLQKAKRRNIKID